MSLKAVCIVVCVFAIAGCAVTSPAPTEQPEVYEQLLAGGDQAARRGDFRTALDLFRRAVRVQPTIDGWMRVGAAAEAFGPSRMAEALFAYEQVLELDPKHIDALEHVGSLYMQSKQYSLARGYFDRVLLIDATRWQSYNTLGVIADHEGNTTLALDYYRDALDLNPTSAVILNNLGYVRFRIGHLDTAMNDFQLALNYDPGYTAAWMNLGRLYAVKRRYPDGLSVLLKVLPLAVAYHEVGYIALRQNDLDAAEMYLRQAVDESPTYYEEAHAGLKQVAEQRSRQRGARTRS